ncbi:WD40 repeat-like protein [Suillus brevipes Sb2]|nr:WD40 repeat-like protein [Suillus brevipes Sb2]
MDAPTKHNNLALATMPYRKIKMNIDIRHILHLLDGKRVIMYSPNGSFRVWDLQTGTQVGEEWEDKYREVKTIVLSPDSKKIASAGSRDGAVKLWNVDTGHTAGVGRMVSGSEDGTFRVWDVESGKTILGPIDCACDVNVEFEPYDSRALYMIATGKLLKPSDGSYIDVSSLAWTSDGKTLIVGGFMTTKIDTATWTIQVIPDVHFIHVMPLSPNGRILASASITDATVILWNLDTNQPIGTPLRHQKDVSSATFSADGKFLVTCCGDRHIYTWDISAIVKEAGLPSDIADVTPRPARKATGARRIPPGFFDDALREANLRIRPSHAPHDRPTPTPRQCILSPFASFWHRSKPHGATEPTTNSQSRPFSWTRNLSSMLRRRNGSDIQLREVKVPCTAGKPRNYHARKKPTASSSQTCDTHTTRQHSMATQNTPSSLQLPPPIAAASTLSAVAGSAGATGTPCPRITIDSGWRARFMLWFCCMPIQHTDGQH